MTECIQTEHLTKHYGKRRGIEDLNMTVPSGMVFCLAGPNGSGKTTTLKILSTLLRQSSGTAVVCGHDVNDDPVGVRRSISLLQQATVVDPYMTVREYLTVFCQMQNPELNRAECRDRVDEIVRVLSLERYTDDTALRLSGGYRRRVQLAKTLVKEAEVYLLDEPTVGFDPEVYRVSWAYIRALTGRGKTVLLTTHNMKEAEENADDVSLIRDGRIVARGAPDELVKRIGPIVLEVVTSRPIDESQVQRVLQNTEWMNYWTSGNSLLVTHSEFDQSENFRERLRRELATDGNTISSVRIRESDLSDAYLVLTGKRK